MLLGITAVYFGVLLAINYWVSKKKEIEPSMMETGPHHGS